MVPGNPLRTHHVNLCGITLKSIITTMAIIPSLSKFQLGPPSTLMKLCAILVRESLWCLQDLRPHHRLPTRFISNTQSFWFLLNTNYDHG